MSDQQFISEEEIKKNPNAIIYDPFNEHAAPNLPNVPEVLDQIIEILEYMSQDNIKKMKNTDPNGYEMHMETKFEKFADRYYGLFKKVSSGDDLTPLLSMLEAIEKIKAGKITMEDAEANLGDELAERFVYPKLSKNQSNEIRNSVKNSRKK